MSATKAVFVLVHGGWHNHSTWDRVPPILEAAGLAALTLDLPGAGQSIAPKSLGVRPFDLAVFAAEPSPVAGVTQEERTQAVITAVKEAASLSDNVILVGHSAGGMTISAVAEQVPELLVAVVYLAGFMVPNGMPLLAMLPQKPCPRHCRQAVRGRPAAIGAIRSMSDQPTKLTIATQRRLWRRVESIAMRHATHCDNRTPAPSPRKYAGWHGAAPYIRCTQDRAIR